MCKKCHLPRLSPLSKPPPPTTLQFFKPIPDAQRLKPEPRLRRLSSPPQAIVPAATLSGPLGWRGGSAPGVAGRLAGDLRHVQGETCILPSTAREGFHGNPTAAARSPPPRPSRQRRGRISLPWIPRKPRRPPVVHHLRPRWLMSPSEVNAHCV
jgi:hypothetical protein